MGSGSDGSSPDAPEAGRPRPPAGERHTAVSVLRTNTLTWFMKVRFELRDWRLRVVSPRAALGVIPYARTDLTYPLEDLSDIRVTRRLYAVRLAAAVALIAVSVFVDVGRIWSAAIELVAVFFFFPLRDRRGADRGSGRSSEVRAGVLVPARCREGPGRAGRARPREARRGLSAMDTAETVVRVLGAVGLAFTLAAGGGGRCRAAGAPRAGRPERRGGSERSVPT